MRKKIKINQKNLNLYLIIIFLVIIFLIKIDLFRNTYSLLNENYNQRMIRIYGDCSKDSFGFLMEIKNKYNFKENPKINNSEIILSSDWIIYDPKLNKNTYILWILPLLLFLFGGAIMYKKIK